MPVLQKSPNLSPHQALSAIEVHQASRTLSCKGFGDFALLKIEFHATMISVSRNRTLKTKYRQRSNLPQVQLLLIPIRD